jgi:hypothetical protein
MLEDSAYRLKVLTQEFERQDRQWALLECQFRELAESGIAVSRSVLDEIDAAFTAPSLPSQPTFLNALLG